MFQVIYIHIHLYVYIYIHTPIYFKLTSFGCAGSLLLHVGFLQLQRAGTTYHCGTWTYCSGFSCCRAQTPGAWALVVGSTWA